MKGDIADVFNNDQNQVGFNLLKHAWVAGI